MAAHELSAIQQNLESESHLKSACRNNQTNKQMYLISQHPNHFFCHHFCLFPFSIVNFHHGLLPSPVDFHTKTAWPATIDVAGMTSRIFAPHGRRDLLNVAAPKGESSEDPLKLRLFRWPQAMPVPGDVFFLVEVLFLFF